MEIKHIDKNKLEFLCIDIITQALADLGQKDNDPENKVMMAQSLAKDLMKRYSFFPIEAVYHSFENFLLYIVIEKIITLNQIFRINYHED